MTELPFPSTQAPTFIPAMTMATLCVCGGALGLVQRGSARLLVGGTLLGGAFAFSSHCLATGQEQRGYRFATATSAILTAVMAQRLIKSRAQPIPNGLLALAGAASTLYHGHLWLEDE